MTRSLQRTCTARYPTCFVQCPVPELRSSKFQVALTQRRSRSRMASFYVRSPFRINGVSIRSGTLNTGGCLPLPELQMVESQWRGLYRAAILELDPKRLQARVKAAEDAINARASSDARISRDERREMNDALSTLHILKRKQS